MSLLDRVPFLDRLQIAVRSRPFGRILFDLLNDLGDFERGSIPAPILNMATEPTAADTFDVGADTYEFVATAGAVSNDANIAIELTGVVADTRDNAVAAINAVDVDNLHANITNVATTAPALANGTEKVVASVVGTGIVTQSADVAGGTPTPADPDILLGEALTAAADVWDVGNVNMNTLAGRAQGQRQVVVTSIVVTAAMITTGSVRIDLPWQPSEFMWSARLATGEHRLTANDLVAPTANGLLLTLNGGVGPDIQGTDIVTFYAWQ